MSFDLDLFGWPGHPERCVFFHNTQGDSGTTGFQTWVKPRGITFVFFVLIGGGACGGNGATGAANSNRGGGGGGGSGVLLTWMTLAALIPDEVYVTVAHPGITGVGGKTGVYWDAHVAVGDAWISAPGATAGTNGSSVAGGGGGAATSMSGTDGRLMADLGVLSAAVATSPSSGASGGAQTGAAGGGISTAFTAGLTIHSGCGGGGVSNGGDFAGGGYTTSAAGFGPLLDNIAGGATGGGRGADGYSPRDGYWLGGTGGGTNDSGTGGAGGNGAIGCGGGGGGAGTTGGKGGIGGPGLAIIACV